MLEELPERRTPEERAHYLAGFKAALDQVAETGLEDARQTLFDLWVLEAELAGVGDD